MIARHSSTTKIGDHLAQLPLAAKASQLRDAITASLGANNELVVERRLGRMTLTNKAYTQGHALAISTIPLVGAGSPCTRRSYTADWSLEYWDEYPDGVRAVCSTPSKDGIVRVAASTNYCSLANLTGFRLSACLAVRLWRENLEKSCARFPSLPKAKLALLADYAVQYEQESNSWHGGWSSTFYALQHALTKAVHLQGRFDVWAVYALTHELTDADEPFTSVQMGQNSGMQRVKTLCRTMKPIALLSYSGLSNGTEDLSVLRKVDPEITCDSVLTELDMDNTQMFSPYWYLTTAKQGKVVVIGKLSIKPRTREAIVNQVARMWCMSVLHEENNE